MATVPSPPICAVSLIRHAPPRRASSEQPSSTGTSSDTLGIRNSPICSPSCVATVAAVSEAAATGVRLTCRRAADATTSGTAAPTATATRVHSSRRERAFQLKLRRATCGAGSTVPLRPVQWCLPDRTVAGWSPSAATAALCGPWWSTAGEHGPVAHSAPSAQASA